MTGIRVGGTRPPQAEDPDRRALELASMCDMVETGVALSMSATYPRPADPLDIVTLAESITAGRGLEAEVEIGTDSLTVHIRTPRDDARHG
jgi:hypothetical protein